ncbi:uncharacterized protein MYCFIDRAFT_75186, partial [Pseudocercospora fijiensis CIRAD86]
MVVAITCFAVAFNFQQRRRLTWFAPAFGGWFVGFGFIFLYNSANNYLVDSYQHQAASALAAKTFLRSFCGAGVVLFTIQTYHRLGDQWASTLLAFSGLACCLIPYVFYYKRAAIRKYSKYAYAGDEECNMKGPQLVSRYDRYSAILPK